MSRGLAFLWPKLRKSFHTLVQVFVSFRTAAIGESEFHVGAGEFMSFSGNSLEPEVSGSLGNSGT